MSGNVIKILAVLLPALSLLWGFFIPHARAASNNAGLHLIPTPKRIEQKHGSFPISTDVVIAPVDTKDPNDIHAATQLVEEIRKDMGLQIPINDAESLKKQTIILTRLQRDKWAQEAVNDLDIHLPSEFDEQSYILDISPTRILIAGSDAPGTFYGVQTLRQLIRAADNNSIPSCRIIDWPSLPLRGWQDDISRGPITTLQYLKRQIRTLAAYKLNMFTMYTEHVFKLKKHPKIAPPDGITAEQVRELVEYAEKYHVQIVGNFQSFGHFANILKVPGYSHLGEADWVISPAKEESYQFLKDVYSEIAPAYKSKYFNINCDETVGLGTGASKQMVRKMGLGGVYAYHINRIDKLLEPYGKTPMMWGDIALHYPDIVPQLPDDLIVLSWGYWARDSFDNKIVPFRKLGFECIVCPGVSCWQRLWPDLDTAVVNISNYLRDGAEHGAMGMLNTTWDDHGENLFSYNWYPLAWGAECAWTPPHDKENADSQKQRQRRLSEFNKSFDSTFFGCKGRRAAESLLALSRLRNYPTTGDLRTKAFWHNPFSYIPVSIGSAADRDPQAVVDKADAIIKTLLQIKADACCNADTIDFVIFAARRARFLGLRMLVRNRISRLAAKREQIDFEGKAAAALKELIDELSAMKAEYERLWHIENRPWWLKRNLQKYDNLINKLSAEKIIAKSIGPDLKLPATITTTMAAYTDHVPELAFDGDIDNNYFWSNRPARRGDNFTVVLEEPKTFRSVKVLTGHAIRPDDYLHNGLLTVSTDGRNYRKIAGIRGAVTEAELPDEPVKAVRIHVTRDQTRWLIIREIMLE